MNVSEFTSKFLFNLKNWINHRFCITNCEAVSWKTISLDENRKGNVIDKDWFRVPFIAHKMSNLNLVNINIRWNYWQQ